MMRAKKRIKGVAMAGSGLKAGALTESTKFRHNQNAEKLLVLFPNLRMTPAKRSGVQRAHCVAIVPPIEWPLPAERSQMR